MNAYHYAATFNDPLAKELRNILTPPGDASPILPNQMEGLSLWLDARYVSTVITNAQGKVSAWNAYYGSGSAIQNNLALQPIYDLTHINGKPAIRCTDSNMYMDTGKKLGPVQTVFVVYKTADIPAGSAYSPFGQHDYDNHRFYPFYTATSVAIAIGSSAYNQKNLVVTPQSVHLWTILADGSRASVRQNGAEIISNMAYSFVGISSLNTTLFARNDPGSPVYLTPSAMGCFLCFDRALTAPEIGMVEIYLKQAWGLSF